MAKTFKQILETYAPRSEDEKRFIDKHVVVKHADRNGNGDDVFKAKKIKIVKRSPEHGHEVGKDHEVYEEAPVSPEDTFLESYTRLHNLKDQMTRLQKKHDAIQGIHPDKKDLSVRLAKLKKEHDALFKGQFREETELNESEDDLKGAKKVGAYGDNMTFVIMKKNLAAHAAAESHRLDLARHKRKGIPHPTLGRIPRGADIAGAESRVGQLVHAVRNDMLKEDVEQLDEHRGFKAPELEAAGYKFKFHSAAGAGSPASTLYHHPELDKHIEITHERTGISGAKKKHYFYAGKYGSHNGGTMQTMHHNLNDAIRKNNGELKEDAEQIDEAYPSAPALSRSAQAIKKARAIANGYKAQKDGKWKSESYKTADGRWASRDVKEDVEQIDEERSSKAFAFTHTPGDEASEKKLHQLKKMVKAHNSTAGDHDKLRIVARGRLGKDNPAADKYRKGGEVWNAKSRPAGSYDDNHNWTPKADGSRKRGDMRDLPMKDAKHHDIYVHAAPRGWDKPGFKERYDKDPYGKITSAHATSLISAHKAISEQIDEAVYSGNKPSGLSNELIGRYRVAANKSLDQVDRGGNQGKAKNRQRRNRINGLGKADMITRPRYNKTVKEDVELTEAPYYSLQASKERMAKEKARAAAREAVAAAKKKAAEARKDAKSNQSHMIARHIETEVGNHYPDSDGYDAIASKLHRMGIGHHDAITHMDKAARKHLGAKSFSHYVDNFHKDYQRDN